MSPKLIILIENDINLRQSIALILQRAGYNVTAIDCVSRALELIHSGNYHLLISDINIPETTDILLPRVRDFSPYLPVVILTDQSITEVEKESQRFSAHYLVKPVPPERLLDSVGSILGKRNNSNHSNNHELPVDRI